jgi:hypothetical protein
MQMFKHSSTRNICFWAAVLVALAFCTASNESTAQDDRDGADKPDVEVLECKVKVVDPDGFPVEEATVFCTGLRSKEEQSSHWGWSEEAFGKAPRIKTDAEGIAVMPYPKMISDEQTTAQMTWSVEHPDFVNYRKDHSVDDDPAEIMLERGFRIALTAINAATGEKLKKNLHAVTSFDGGSKWELKKNGMFVSSVMKKQSGIMRVAWFQEDKPTFFSKEIKIEPGDKSRLLLKDVELSVGCRVEGKLNETVTRPVKDGFVIATLVKKPNSHAWNSLWWSDETKIAEDGTFVFESLPADEAIQMIPICDGFVPAKPKLADVLAALPIDNPDRLKGTIEAFTATPQMVKSDRSKVTTTLAMNKSSSVTVKVVDPDGEPVENVRVATNPNQYWFNGGSQILGKSFPTRKLWKMQQDGIDLTGYFQANGHPYMKTTDKDGIACLNNMPNGFHRIGVYEKEWELRTDPMSGDRVKLVKVQDKDRSVTVKVFPKGTLPRNNQQQPPITETIMNWWSQLIEGND